MIYCIGDSFTAGDELSDWIPTRNKTYPISQLAWPALLGQKLNQPVKNLGRGGCGNTRIVKRAMDATLIGADLVVVAWATPLRIELADEFGVFDVWPNRNINVMAHDESRALLVKWFTVHHNGEEEEKFEQWYYAAWLRQVILLQSFFKINNQRYIMIASDPIYHRNNKYQNQFNKLYNQIDSTYFAGWPTHSMQDWAHGLPKGPHHHFLEEGHQRVADKVYEYIRNLGWIS